MVKGECTSYKDLPVSLYQIQSKYRDEARPRAGILRGREFLMKDSYSFDLDDEGLKTSYEAHRATYVKIFDRLGMDYRVVSAVSGAMGGSASEEFLAIAPTGEDSFVSCTSCDYAANVEAVEVGAGTAESGEHGPLEVMDTPDTPTIETLATFLGITAGETLKNVVVKLVQPDGSVEPLIVGVPGDREIDMKRLEANVAPAEVVAFEGEDFAKHPGLVRGYIGPQGDLGVRYVVDPLVAEGTAWVTGANTEGKHARNVVMGRDFTPDGFLAAAEVRDGDPCPRCGSGLSLDRGIEIGHVFQLGRKYADAFSLDVLGPEGKPVRVTMGSYGIGVSRAVAAIAEQSHDDTRSDLAARDRAGRRARGHRRPGRAAGGRPAARRAARGRRAARAARRPAQGQPRRRVQGRRADRHPDLRRGRQDPRGRRHGRDPRPQERQLPQRSRSPTPSPRCWRRSGADRVLPSTRRRVAATVGEASPGRTRPGADDQRATCDARQRRLHGAPAGLSRRAQRRVVGRADQVAPQDAEVGLDPLGQLRAPRPGSPPPRRRTPPSSAG